MKRNNTIFNIHNEFEDFIEKLIDKTEKNTLKWKPSSNTLFISKYVTDSEKAFRIYTASISERTLIMIEKKIPIMHEEIEDYFDQIFQELYIITNDNLEIMLNQNSVSESLLSELAAAISKKASNLSDFLKSID
jgi:dihydroxyacetone kinase-like predicted kinase